MKKIVCILGSPRKNGSTSAIADRFLDTAKQLGAETRSFYLNEMTYKGCQGCMACKGSSEECVLRDDLTDALRAARDCDVLVMASPIYFADVTAQMKGFVDRTYSFLKPTYLTDPDPSRLAPGKTCVFIFTQGSPDPAMFDIFPTFDRFYSWFGFKNHLIRGVGLNPKQGIAEQPELLERAERLAREIVG